MKKPFGHIGGKSLLAKAIINQFPKNYDIYVEPFFGGGSLYFKKEPSEVEVINDLDKDISTLMKGFKKFNGDKISDALNQPISKVEFKKLLDSKPSTEWTKFLRLLKLKKNSFLAKSKNYDNKTHNSDYGSRYQERLKNTIILNQDYKTVIKKYDSSNTFFYLDPPYENSKDYKHNDIDYKALEKLLRKIKGKFILSINYSPEFRKLFSNFKLKLVLTKYSGGTDGGQPLKKKELLIMNF